MSPERAARLHEAVDRQSGEAFLFAPMAPAGGDVNSRPIADPTRAAMQFTGIWVAPHAGESRYGRPLRPVEKDRRISASRPTVKYADGALPYPAALGDRISRVATGDSYEVAELGGDGYGRVVLSLTARGSL